MKLIDSYPLVKVTKTCWLWQGHLDKEGYGRRSARSAHRYFYELFRGPIPKGYTIDHLCKVRNCVNPKHLRCITAHETALQGGAFWKTRTHCKYGHRFTPTNIVYERNGEGYRMRRCRKCLNASSRRSHQKRRLTERA